MSDYQAGIAAAVFVKTLIILAGVAAMFMGYKLFERGVYRGGATLGWKDVLSLGKGGPGLGFAALGAVVLVMGIRREMGTYGRSGAQPAEPVPAGSSSGSPMTGPSVRRAWIDDDALLRDLTRTVPCPDGHEVEMQIRLTEKKRIPTLRERYLHQDGGAVVDP